MKYLKYVALVLLLATPVFAQSWVTQNGTSRLSANSSNPAMKVVQNGTGNILELWQGNTRVLAIGPSIATSTEWVPTYVGKTAAYTAVSNDWVGANGTFTVTLPLSLNLTTPLTVANISTSGTITVGVSGSDTINGASTATLNPGDSMSFMPNGSTAWFIF